MTSGVRQVRPAGTLPTLRDIQTRRVNPRGSHNRSQADLQSLLGYTKWERFEDSIERVKIAANNAGTDPDQHFSRRREALGVRRTPARKPHRAF